jgi:hypothetical protein
MMSIRLHAILLAAVLPLALATTAHAQRGYVEGFGGVLIVDDGKLADAEIDPSALFGGVLGLAIAPGWEVAAAYGYSPITVTILDEEPNEEIDGKIHVYFGAVNYVFPSERAFHFLVTAGLGGLMIDADVEGADSSNDFLVNFGGGLRYAASERIAIQGTVRDHVQFCKAIEEDSDKVSICPDDDAALNHIEISGGLLVLF